MRHVMVPEVGVGRGQTRVAGGVQRWGLPTTQTPGRLNAPKAFPGLEPKEAGSEGNSAPTVYGCEGFCSPPDWLQVCSGRRGSGEKATSLRQGQGSGWECGGGAGGTGGQAEALCSAWQGHL